MTARVAGVLLLNFAVFPGFHLNPSAICSRSSQFPSHSFLSLVVFLILPRKHRPPRVVESVNENSKSESLEFLPMFSIFASNHRARISA
jgi:hypothetical protein